MKLFFDISRLMPAVILLTFAVVGQSFAVSHGGVAKSHATEHEVAYVICADGELKTVTLDQNGEPTGQHHDGIHCPLCILGASLALPPVSEKSVLVRHAYLVEYSRSDAVIQVREVRPDILHCLDPPSA